MSSKDLMWLIEEHNPFAFKDERRRIEYYPTYREAYLDAMKKIFNQAPRGYFDLMLFLSDHCELRGIDARLKFNDFRRLSGGVIKTDVILIDWTEPRQYVDMLRYILQGLHTISETTFSESYFLSALEEFKNKTLINLK